MILTLKSLTSKDKKNVTPISNLCQKVNNLIQKTMSISTIYESGTQQNNIAHFASIANIAAVDGQINESEEKLLFRFANKLDINEEQIEEILHSPRSYPINPPSSKEKRLEYIYDLFRMIYVDHQVDEKEIKLIHSYAIGLGCTSSTAKEVIEKSIKIFGGEIDFEDYNYLINKKD